MPMLLYVKCKTCETQFPSPIQIDEQSFQTATLINNSYQCPNSHQNPYDKSDHFFVEVK